MRVWIDQGGAYGNLGDEAMLLVAAQRLRAAYHDATLLIGALANQPIPAITDSRVVTPPFQFIAGIHQWLDRQPFALACRALPNDWRHRMILQLADRPRLLPRYLRDLRQRILDDITSCDLCYSVGAANLNDWAMVGCVLPRLWLARHFKKQSKPVIVSAQTVGPIQNKYTAQLVRQYVDHATTFTLRDLHVSLDCLRNIRADVSNINVVGDEAFNLTPNLDAARDYLKCCGLHEDQPFTLLHFRQTDYRGNIDPRDPRLTAIVKATAQTRRVLLCPMSYAPHSGDDATFLAEVAAATGLSDRVLAGPTIRDARLARGLVRQSQRVVSLSYHLQVFAIAEAKPFVCLVSGHYYQHKADALLGWLDPDMRYQIELDQAHACAGDTLLDFEVKAQTMAAHLDRVRRDIQHRQTQTLPQTVVVPVIERLAA